MEKICERHNLPRSVDIFGANVAINFVSGLRDEDGEAAWGQALLNEDPISISLDDSMTARKSYRTLIHEILEIINGEAELGLGHGQICVLEIGLADFLLNNDIDWGYTNGIARD